MDDRQLILLGAGLVFENPTGNGYWLAKGLIGSMELSFSCNSLLQLQSELGTSCSGLSEQDYIGSGLGFRGSSDFGRFKLLKELNSKRSLLYVQSSFLMMNLFCPVVRPIVALQ